MQIRPRPRWQVAARSVPAAILGLAVACAALIAALAVALARFPGLTLLLAGCVALGLATSR